MQLQLSIFLIVYVVFLLLILMTAFFNLYHILKFGFAGFWSYLLTFSYVIIMIGTLVASFIFIAGFDWNMPIAIFQNNKLTF